MDRRRLLVISGDEPLVARIRTALGARPGLEIEVVAGGEWALKAATEPDLAAVLFDPHDGLPLAELERLLAETAGRLPVLAVGADYPVEAATVLFRLGVADYLSMAHHAESLPAVLDALTRGAEADEPARARRSRLGAPVS